MPRCGWCAQKDLELVPGPDPDSPTELEAHNQLKKPNSKCNGYITWAANQLDSRKRVPEQ